MQEADLPQYRSVYARWRAELQSSQQPPDGDLNVDLFVRSLNAGTTHRRFYVTQNGFMGLGPANCQPNDLVVVLYGGYVPFVLRLSREATKLPDSEDANFILVGDTYIHGFMDGEAIKARDTGSLKEQTFVLV